MKIQIVGGPLTGTVTLPGPILSDGQLYEFDESSERYYHRGRCPVHQEIEELKEKLEGARDSEEYHEALLDDLEAEVENLRGQLRDAEAELGAYRKEVAS